MLKNKLVGREKAILTAAILLAAIAFMLFSGVETAVSDGGFTVRGTLSGKKELQYRDVVSLEYRETLDTGSRAMGAETFRTLCGSFRNAEFGAYSLYAYRNAGAYIVARGADGGVLAFNRPTAAETKELYDQIFAGWEQVWASSAGTEEPSPAP